MAAAGPSRLEDEDVEMMDVEFKHEGSDHDDGADEADGDEGLGGPGGRDEPGDELGDVNGGSSGRGIGNVAIHKGRCKHRGGHDCWLCLRG